MTVVSARPIQISAWRPPIRPKFIDLFAGCGGLSLGLEMAGFEPIFVNELDPNAMQSYLINRPEFSALSQPKGNSYDIFDVTARDGKLQALVGHVKNDLAVKDLDLVVGGPPCQGYSGIGHRRTFTDVRKLDIPSNHLYREMAKFIEAFRPKMFLFENVKGLLSARWTPDGEKAEIWEDVTPTFELIPGYRSAGSSSKPSGTACPRTGRGSCLSVSVTTSIGSLTKASLATGCPQPSGITRPGRLLV